MRSALAALVFLLPMACLSQAGLKGIVTLQNSKTLTGKAIGVSGMQIKAGAATSTRTKDDGSFALQFIGKTPGQKVLLTLEDPEGKLEVVNKADLTAVLMAANEKDNLVKLYMCKKGDLDKNIAAYYNINIAPLLRGHELKIKQLMKEGKLSQDRIAGLEEEKKKLEQKLLEMSEEYALLNLDDASEREKKAAKYFKAGKLDSALYALDFEKTKSELAAYVAKVKKDEELLKQHREGRDTSIQKMVRIANLLVITGDDSAAEAAFNEAISADTTNAVSNFYYAEFLATKYQLEDALKFYRLSERHARDDDMRALASLGQGQVYLKMNKFELAFGSFRMAETLSGTTGNSIQLGAIYTAQGILFSKEGRLNDALKATDKALQLYEQLAAEDTLLLGTVAELLSNTGVMFKEQGNFSLSIIVYKKALDIQRSLANYNPDLYESPLAVTLSNLANSYMMNNQLDSALKYGEEGLTIKRRLVSVNPEIYESRLIESLNSMVGVYTGSKQLETAERIALEAHSILQRRVKQEPDVFEPEFARALFHLGGIYYEKKDFTKSEKFLLEAVAIRRRLSAKNPAEEKFLVNTLYKLGILYADMKNVKNAQQYLQECAELAERISKADPGFRGKYVQIMVVFCAYVRENNLSYYLCK